MGLEKRKEEQCKQVIDSEVSMYCMLLFCSNRVM